MTRNLERFFYHSFPRPKKGIDSLGKGFETLKSIAEFGLVLTPEISEWKERLQNGTLSKPWYVCQKRACFTELSPTELDDHSKQFGPFSLEFDLDTLRKLGAIPVFYLPRASSAEKSLEHLGATYMARMGEIQQLLDRLSTLDKAGSARDLIEILKHDSQPVQVLQAALQAFSGFFYPTEDLNYTTLLAYYRQREWRIVGNVVEDGQPIMRKLTEKEKARLVSIDKEFFEKIKKFRSGDSRCVDQCLIFPSYNGKPFIQYARRIIVPSERKNLADKILKPVINNETEIISATNLAT